MGSFFDCLNWIFHSYCGRMCMSFPCIMALFLDLSGEGFLAVDYTPKDFIFSYLDFCRWLEILIRFFSFYSTTLWFLQLKPLWQEYFYHFPFCLYFLPHDFIQVIFFSGRTFQNWLSSEIISKFYCETWVGKNVWGLYTYSQSSAKI